MNLAQYEKLSAPSIDISVITPIWDDLRHRLGLSPIHSKAQFKHMVQLMNSLVDEVGGNEKHPLADLVAMSVRLKADIVAADEFEEGRRALLNYGHTLGHALEVLALARASALPETQKKFDVGNIGPAAPLTAVSSRN